MKKQFLISTFIFTLTSCTKGFIPEYTNITEPVDSIISYSSHIKPVITQYCISCHSGSSPQGNLNLINYSQVRSAIENNSLIQRVNDPINPMPPSGLMPIQTRALFDEWIKNGYLEN